MADLLARVNYSILRCAIYDRCFKNLILILKSSTLNYESIKSNTSILLKFEDVGHKKSHIRVE